MITKLSVSNYALIDALELDMQPGFTTLTGETGAGKSIILGALRLCLGHRADSKTLKNPDVKCVVELFCDISKLNLESFFEEHDLDFDQQTIIRREILPSGKSRAFINDLPTRVDVLSKLSNYIIDIHSQGDTLLLNNNDYQIDLLDTFGNSVATLSEYQKAFSQYKAKKKEKEDLLAATGAEDREYIDFQVRELSQFKLTADQASTIEEDLEELQHADVIQSAYAQSFNSLDDEETGVLAQLKKVKSELSQVSRYSKQAEELCKRIESAQIELADVSSEIEELSFQIEADPVALEKLTNTYNEFQNLLAKYKVSTLEELKSRESELNDVLFAIDNASEKLAKIDREIEAAKALVVEKAHLLHQERKRVIPSLLKEMAGYLTDLNLAHSKFDISLEPTEKMTSRGMDSLEFRFSANPGSPLQNLAKVASGGEMSRVMLALKAIMAKSKALPSIIFDEIDTGISGETAEKMAFILRNMGEAIQVLAITHLPQIASRGNHHFKVEKTSDEHSTQSTIYALNEKQRVDEVARMLSGVEMTEAAIKNAEQLLGIAQ